MYKVRTIPHLVLVDHLGVVRYVHRGLSTVAALEKKLQSKVTTLLDRVPKHVRSGSVCLNSSISAYCAGDSTSGATATYDALRWRAVGTWVSQHAIVQKRSFIFPELQEVTEQR